MVFLVDRPDRFLMFTNYQLVGPCCCGSLCVGWWQSTEAPCRCTSLGVWICQINGCKLWFASDFTLFTWMLWLVWSMQPWNSSPKLKQNLWGREPIRSRGVATRKVVHCVFFPRSFLPPIHVTHTAGGIVYHSYHTILNALPCVRLVAGCLCSLSWHWLVNKCSINKWSDRFTAPNELLMEKILR